MVIPFICLLSLQGRIPVPGRAPLNIEQMNFEVMTWNRNTCETLPH
ncbi:hypothetical protein C4K40_3313 [Pseudomonas sp. CMR5c]|nr:hypothetical protein C4K40_3313 [Pseudomonas sp. CMR5c]